ncbi:MAG: hypothetical protein Q8K32_09245 [Archangium sp.]|nr:hypothetical protein [Archangium sp.]
MNFKDVDVYDGQPEGFHVGSWCPTPTPTVPPTQVHLTMPITGLGTVVARFKGTGTLDQLIAALIKHRVDVWGVPTDPKTWQVEP